MKTLIALTCLLAAHASSYSQTDKEEDQKSNSKEISYTYAYVTVSPKLVSSKLDVDVDLGDTQDQIKEGKEISELLKNKKSYAAILNTMAAHQYELVETLTMNYSYQGTGATSGLVFIMRKTGK